jgi:hypothetical protein
MLKFVSIHPVIRTMDRLYENDYLVHETLKVGPIPISFAYPANVYGSHDRQSVTMRATVLKIARIEMNFLIREIPTGTLVEEEVVFACRLPVDFIMLRIFRSQHTKLFENMRNAAE